LSDDVADDLADRRTIFFVVVNTGVAVVLIAGDAFGGLMVSTGAADVIVDLAAIGAGGRTGAYGTPSPVIAKNSPSQSYDGFAVFVPSTNAYD
jgi:hypothetical protein